MLLFFNELYLKLYGINGKKSIDSIKTENSTTKFPAYQQAGELQLSGCSNNQ
jgi:hypothetical protein